MQSVHVRGADQTKWLLTHLGCQITCHNTDTAGRDRVTIKNKKQQSNNNGWKMIQTRNYIGWVVVGIIDVRLNVFNLHDEWESTAQMSHVDKMACVAFCFCGSAVYSVGLPREYLPQNTLHNFRVRNRQICRRFVLIFAWWRDNPSVNFLIAVKAYSNLGSTVAMWGKSARHWYD